MKIVTVNLARAMVFFPGGAEIAIGRIPIEAATKFMSERYGFHVYPKTFAEWQKSDGVELVYGQRDGVIITRMTLYARGIGVDTQTNTEDCEKIIDDLLASGGDVLGISIKGPVTRRLYQSDLTFISNAALNAIHPAVAVLATRVEPFAAAFLPERKYELTKIQLSVDDANLKYTAGPFRIERREGIPFSDNAYFSSAPMPTAAHAAALEEFEASLLKGQRL